MAAEDDPALNAELITDILQRRLSVLGISISPILVPHQADVVFHVAAPDNTPGNPVAIVRLLAHSTVLKKGSDYFRDILAKDDFVAPSPSSDGDAADTNRDDAGEGSRNSDDASEGFGSVSNSAASFSISSIPGSLSLSAGEAGDTIVSLERRDLSPSSSSPEASEATDFRSSSSGPGTTILENLSSSENPSLLTAQGSASSESNVSDAKPTVHGPRRSILLSSSPRKSLLERRNSVSSARKSVRFSVSPAHIIPAVKTSQDNQIHGQDLLSSMSQEDLNQLTAKHMEGLSANSDDVLMVDRTEEPSPKPDKRDDEVGRNMENLNTSKITYIDKPMIKRRHTEVNIVMEKKEEKNDGTALKYFVVKKHDWTAPVLIGILEWLYLGMAHINIVDIAAVYNAAYRAAITSLTWCIRRHPIADYLNLALINYPVYCQSLLDLCLHADSRELITLKCFCQALKAIDGTPEIAIFETKSIEGRAKNFLQEGFLVLDGHPICVLAGNKSEEDGDSSDELSQSCEPDPFLTFSRAAQHSVSTKSTLAKMFQKLRNSNKEQTWRVVLLDNDPAGSLHAFFNYVTVCNLMDTAKRTCRDIRVMQRESYKFQMITRFKIGAILVKALRKGIREGLTIREERGAGAYIKGPSYCTSLVLEGEPSSILLAAKAIPYEMMGRCALEIRAPNLRTFCDLFYASHTFGVDLQSHNIVLVKPLYVLIKILEYITKLNADAYEEPGIQRTLVELIEPILFV